MLSVDTYCILDGRSSVDIRVMSAPVSRRASTLMCRAMMMER